MPLVVFEGCKSHLYAHLEKPDRLEA